MALDGTLVRRSTVARERMITEITPDSSSMTMEGV
jgi:hypothetical protein